jgi:hypothetical protein
LGVIKTSTNRAVVNLKTGVVVHEMQPGDRIIRRNTVEYLGDTMEINHGEPYAKAYIKPMFALARALSGQELQMVYFLLPYISYESGILMHSNGRKLTRGCISDATGLGLRTVDRLLQSLHAKQVIGRHNNGREVHYTVNPWLFMRGKRINRTLYEFFKTSRWAKVCEIER